VQKILYLLLKFIVFMLVFQQIWHFFLGGCYLKLLSIVNKYWLHRLQILVPMDLEGNLFCLKPLSVGDLRFKELADLCWWLFLNLSRDRSRGYTWLIIENGFKHVFYWKLLERHFRGWLRFWPIDFLHNDLLLLNLQGCKWDLNLSLLAVGGCRRGMAL